jgi:hypothetical protein
VTTVAEMTVSAYTGALRMLLRASLAGVPARTAALQFLVYLAMRYGR